MSTIIKIYKKPYILRLLMLLFSTLGISERSCAQLPEQASSGNKEKQPTISENVLKTNLLSPALLCVAVQFERAWHKNFSAGLTITRMFKRGLGPFLSFGDPFLLSLRFSGWSVTPEFRIYPGKKLNKPAPHGFYLAAYARLTRFTIDETFHFSAIDNSGGFTGYLELNAQAQFHYTGIAPGIMIGYQWILMKNLSIDWWFIGGHYGQAWFEGKFESEAIATHPNDFMEAALSIDGPGGLSTSGIKVSGNTATFRTGAPLFRGIRTGLCLGFSF